MLDTASAPAEPLFEVAQLATVELYSPVRDKSVAFFTDILGMYTVKKDATSTYLRGYEDPYAYSLQITDAKHAGSG